MPYKKFAVGGGFKVWKVDEQGEKVGDPLSGEPMEEGKADAQVRALYASEKKPKKEVEKNGYEGRGEEGGMAIPYFGPCTWEELDALEAAQETAEHMQDMTWKFRTMAESIMQNPMLEDKAQALVDLAQGYAERVKRQEVEKQLRLIIGENQPKEKDDRDATLKAIWTTKFVNNLPDFCFLYVEPGDKDGEGKTVPRNKRHFPYKDSSGKVDLPHLRNAIARIPQSNAPGLTTEKKTQLQDRARKMLEDAQEKKELYIWKEGDIYKWLAAYSNNRRDNDNPPEIISSDSHKEFDTALHEGKWPMPELWVWHVPLAVGQTTYHIYDESSGFPLAGGVFNKGFEWVAEGLERVGWTGVSHGMPGEWIQRSENDPTIIIRHRTKEISILPQWAAANRLTFNIISKENDMTDETKALPEAKKIELIAAFGDNARQFLEAVENTSKEADEAGIEKKETGELTPDNPIVKALGDIVQSLTSLEQRLKALEEKPVVEEKEEPFDLISFLQGKSAIGKPETKVDGRSSLAKDRPEEVEQPSVTQAAGGIRVTLADQFIGANQAWYADKGGK